MCFLHQHEGIDVGNALCAFLVKDGLKWIAATSSVLFFHVHMFR